MEKSYPVAVGAGKLPNGKWMQKCVAQNPVAVGAGTLHRKVGEKVAIQQKVSERLATVGLPLAVGAGSTERKTDNDDYSKPRIQLTRVFPKMKNTARTEEAPKN